jgi:hypothetical protein
MRTRGVLLRALALGSCAVAVGVGPASARAADAVKPVGREDPSRPGRPATKVGWYVRGGLGIGYDWASTWHRVETASESSHGSARFESRYSGAGARVEAIGALRVARALMGMGFVFGDTRAETTPSAETRTLELAPGRGRQWWLVGPMGGAQLGRGQTWVVAGMAGLGRTRTPSFEAPQGIAVDHSLVHGSLLGISAWGGPCWPLGNGWLLGAHLRFTTVRSHLIVFEESDAGSELALLADISFQSP